MESKKRKQFMINKLKSWTKYCGNCEKPIPQGTDFTRIKGMPIGVKLCNNCKRKHIKILIGWKYKLKTILWSFQQSKIYLRIKREKKSRWEKMNNIKINKIAKKTIKEHTLHPLLSSLVQEIREQKGYEYFFNCATKITKGERIRYMFLALPEDKDCEKIEFKMTELVYSHNKKLRRK